MSFFKPKDDIYIIGPSFYVPPTIIDNDSLLKLMDVKIKGSWVEKRVGVKTRHWVEKETCSDLAIEASRKLFKSSKNFKKENIGLIILSTISGDFLSPPSSPIVQFSLGLDNVGAFDLGAACSGFVTALINSASMRLMTDKDILLASSEVRSKFLNSKDFNTFSLFGDGASSAVITHTSENANFKLLGGQLIAEGSVLDLISIPAGGSKKPYGDSKEEHCLVMKEGAEIYIKALDGMYQSSLKILENLDLSLNDISWVVPHQANLHMVKALAQRLDFPMDRVTQTIKKWGNTSGASVGMGLSDLLSSNQLSSGEKILLISAGGGGLSANAVLEVV